MKDEEDDHDPKTMSYLCSVLEDRQNQLIVNSRPSPSALNDSQRRQSSVRNSITSDASSSFANVSQLTDDQ